ncbi:transglutaminase-like domain-containing protein [Caenimonas aquaedulcis]|uniref:Transglutaminase domain-containing protein n=1 Tax=Caenimonas aquaedulcis TaxID=2793270 RepID=A0A931H7R9_9BURK|nr:transglutaminase domain-containing protein [Caenimonas aquaedulcis]
MSPSLESKGSGTPAARDDPGRWLGSGELLDLEDPKLRLRAHSLTQLCKNERERALAIYGFVKRITFAKAFKLRQATAREVMAAGRGDADDKATLLIALMRAADIPARLRYIELRGEILRGLTSGVASAARPLAEIWVADRWMRTDTYIFDAAYMAAARQRLKDADWEWGYGIHRDGHAVWSAAGDAYLGGMATAQDPMVLHDFGLFNDPLDLVQSDGWKAAHPRIARAVQWNVLAPMMEKVVRELRQEASGPPPQSPAPRRIS